MEKMPSLGPGSPFAGKPKRAVSLVILFLLLILYLGAWFYELNLPVGPGPAQEVLVPQGAGVKEIALLLKERGLIRSPWFFVLLAQIKREATCLKAGEYRLSPRWTTLEILQHLASGEVVLHRVTIPEGLTRWQIASLLAARGLTDKQSFLAATANATLLKRLRIPGATAEGYLFPETYTLAKGLPPATIVTRMVKQFWRVWSSLVPRARQLGVSVKQVVILASIVEKEAKVAEERPLIAGVFWNRLKRGMPLQADPTVRYALRKFQGPLTRKDLQVDSPYNTYLHPGLPPGPICNPGRASLQAVLYPAKTDYLYFVAKGDGTHYFSRTLKEHLRAIHRFRYYRDKAGP